MKCNNNTTMVWIRVGVNFKVIIILIQMTDRDEPGRSIAVVPHAVSVTSHGQTGLQCSVQYAVYLKCLS